MAAEEFFKIRHTIIPIEENSYSKEELFEFAEAYAEQENKQLFKNQKQTAAKNMVLTKNNYQLEQKNKEILHQYNVLTKAYMQLEEENEKLKGDSRVLLLDFCAKKIQYKGVRILDNEEELVDDYLALKRKI